MVKLLPRTEWASRGPVAPLTPLVARAVEGIAIHWPGTTGPIGDPGRNRIAARLEGYRAYHTGQPPVGRGWSDIAYNVAVDQAGRVWNLRGIGVRSAANGDQVVNATWVALLALVGPGEKPTGAMQEAIVAVRHDLVLSAFPGARAVRGHRDVRRDPTDCPGDDLEALIRAGRFVTPRPIPAPKPPPEIVAYRLERWLLLGCTGADVAAWQKRVNQLLAGKRDDTRVDGDFGPDTHRATKDAQEVLDVKADGIVGPDTCEGVGWVWKR